MGKNRIAGLAAVGAVVLALAGCGNSKMQQENEQLKSQVLDLQKDNGDLGNRVEEATTAEQSLTKENEQLKDENNALKARRPKAKTAERRHRRNRKASPA